MLAGTAPVTRRSGKRWRVAMRRSCNHRLRTAMRHWARANFISDPYGRAFYDRLRARGLTHERDLIHGLEERAGLSAPHHQPARERSLRLVGDEQPSVLAVLVLADRERARNRLVVTAVRHEYAIVCPRLSWITLVPRALRGVRVVPVDAFLPPEISRQSPKIPGARLHVATKAHLWDALAAGDRDRGVAGRSSWLSTPTSTSRSTRLTALRIDVV